MSSPNLNTPEYWDGVYREECESGMVSSGHYNRDYGPIHDTVVALIPPGSRVLDVACGPGLLCRKISQRVDSAQVTGVDFSDYMIQHNQARDRALPITYRCLDIRGSFSTLDGPYDAITMCEILEHLEKPVQVVAEVMQRLRTGGRFILTCPHDDEIPDPEHLRQWGHDEVFHLLAPYADTVSFRQFPPPYYHPWMLAYLTKKS